MTRESKETLKEVREGLKEIDIYMGMLQKKGRKLSMQKVEEFPIQEEAEQVSPR